MRKQDTVKHVALLTFLIVAMSVIPALTWSQNDTGPGDQTRLQIRERIDQSPDMDDPQRDRMRNNLENCLRLGLSAEEIAAVFPGDRVRGNGHPEQMLAMQERILELADRDLPVEPMMGKIMEGRMKNVSADRMERVLEQTENNIRNSHRLMMGAIEGGVQAPPPGGGMHEANRELAHCLWDGMTEGDMEQIREQAMVRARDGGCTIDQFVAACQAANRFGHSGIDQDQAVQMAGEALHNGYSATDMRTMGHMMMSGSESGGHHGEMAGHMQGWIHEGMHIDEMTTHMMDGGWMGPADMMGAGGHHGLDNTGMGGPGHDGGGHSGGHGGDDDGGHGGGHDGGGNR